MLRRKKNYHIAKQIKNPENFFNFGVRWSAIPKGVAEDLSIGNLNKF